MSLHFQVYADFTLLDGKPQLIKTSIFSTKAAVTKTPIYPHDNKYLVISRIFHTLAQAHSYITYLHGVYPTSPAPPPVLDTAGRLSSRPLILPISARPEGAYSGQKDLFSEVTT